MKQYDEKFKTLVSMMINSPDWGSRFFDAYIPTFIRQSIKALHQSSQYKELLPELEVKEDKESEYVAFFNNDILDREDTYFGYSKKGFLEDEVLNLNRSEANRANQIDAIGHLLRFPAHEFRHYEQEFIMKEKSMAKIDPMAVVFAKETLVMAAFPEFYSKNHNFFAKEIDAEIHGFYESINLSSQLKGVSPSIISKYINDNKRYFNDYRVYQNDYFVKKDLCDEISSKTDEVMRRLNPNERGKIINKYPVLKIMYNQNGDKRTYEEIMNLKKQYKTGISNPSFIENIEKVFDMVIRTDKTLRTQHERYSSGNNIPNNGISNQKSSSKSR